MLTLKSFVGSVLSTVSVASWAQYGGAQFQRDILSEDREKQIAAVYFINGVVDQTQLVANALQLASGEGYNKSMFFCIPPSAKLGDVVAVVKARMNRPSIALSEPAATHITRAVRDVWPCR